MLESQDRLKLLFIEPMLNLGITLSGRGRSQGKGVVLSTCNRLAMEGEQKWQEK